MSFKFVSVEQNQIGWYSISNEYLTITDEVSGHTTSDNTNAFSRPGE